MDIKELELGIKELKKQQNQYIDKRSKDLLGFLKWYLDLYVNTQKLHPNIKDEVFIVAKAKELERLYL